MEPTTSNAKSGRKMRARPPRFPQKPYVLRERRTISIAHDLDQKIFDRAQEANTTYSGFVEESMRTVVDG